MPPLASLTQMASTSLTVPCPQPQLFNRLWTEMANGIYRRLVGEGREDSLSKAKPIGQATGSHSLRIDLRIHPCGISLCPPPNPPQNRPMVVTLHPGAHVGWGAGRICPSGCDSNERVNQVSKDSR